MDNNTILAILVVVGTAIMSTIIRHIFAYTKRKNQEKRGRLESANAYMRAKAKKEHEILDETNSDVNHLYDQHLRNSHERLSYQLEEIRRQRYAPLNNRLYDCLDGTSVADRLRKYEEMERGEKK